MARAESGGAEIAVQKSPVPNWQNSNLMSVSLTFHAKKKDTNTETCN